MGADYIQRDVRLAQLQERFERASARFSASGTLSDYRSACDAYDALQFYLSYGPGVERGRRNAYDGTPWSHFGAVA